MAAKRGFTAWGAPYYDTGWIANSDWTDRNFDPEADKNVQGTVVHNLNTPLAYLWTKLLISQNGLDDGAEEFVNTALGTASGGWGHVISETSHNEIVFQTGNNGLLRLTGSGAPDSVNVEDWFYRIVLIKMI